MTPPTDMPGTTGKIRHPDVSEISDLTEGLLSPSRTTEVRNHLGDCALCADVRDSLEEIRALLGTLPGPPRMPSDIAGRIDAALAAEALLNSTGRPTEPTGEAETPAERDVSRETSPPGSPGSPGSPGPTRSPGSPAPGAARPAGHPVGATGPGRRRARRRIAVLAGLAGAAACVLGIFLASSLGGTPADHTTARTSTAVSPPAADGSYTAQGLPGNVHRLLASGKDTQSAQGEAQGERNKTYGIENASPGLAPGERQAPSVPPCVQQATGRPDTPLAAEHGSYQGTAVYLVVLPHPGDPARVDAYLVADSCVDAPSAAPGTPLLTATYPRA